MDYEKDRWVRSEEARTRLRSLIDEVEHEEGHVYLLRYDRPVAVLVPVGWYEDMKAATGEEGKAP
jgi:PHD/YefM family antitoxin component YafN of YafNO toxin-antitoxin module